MTPDELEAFNIQSFGWTPPVPLDARLPLAPFPLEVFPARLQEFIRAGCLALGCPPDYLAVPLLPLAGVAIGAGRTLALSRTSCEQAKLFAAVIAPPGRAAADALDLLLAPLEEIQEESWAQWCQKKAQDSVPAKGLAKKSRASFAVPAGTLSPESACGPQKTPDPFSAPPPLLQTWTDDATPAGLTRILDENPRGVALVRDNLLPWLASQRSTRSPSGSFFHDCWAARRTVLFRPRNLRALPFRRQPPCLGVAGCLPAGQTEELTALAQSGNGVLDRVLLSFPEVPAAMAWADGEMPPAALQAWREIIRRLHALELPRDGFAHNPPFRLHLQPDAHSEWVRFYDAHQAEQLADDFPECLRGPWAALAVAAGRLALVLHLLRWAAGEPSTPEVTAATVTAAWQLVAYFKSHVRRLHGCLGTNDLVADARRILAWISRERPDGFKRWELHKDIRTRKRFAKPAALDEPLALLVEHGFLQEHEIDDGSHRGPRAGPTFSVNPIFLGDLRRAEETPTPSNSPRPPQNHREDREITRKEVASGSGEWRERSSTDPAEGGVSERNQRAEAIPGKPDQLESRH
jgi:hypothetical protein